MKNSLLLLIFLLPLFIACTPHKGVDVLIRNKTGKDIAEISLCTDPCTANARQIAIPGGKSAAYFLDMRRVSGGDGRYEVRYRFVNDSTVHRKYFGYFTNGSPTHDKMELTIFENRVVEKSL